TSVPAPASAAIVCACAKASPSSRRRTSVNGGGSRSSGSIMRNGRAGASSGIGDASPLAIELSYYTIGGSEASFMTERHILVCSCDDTMPQAADTVRRTCGGARVSEGRQFCRAELDRFRTAAQGGEQVTVTCT